MDWRVSVDIVGGSDFMVPYETQDEAFTAVKRFIADGFVTRFGGPQIVIYPLVQVRSFSIHPRHS